METLMHPVLGFFLNFQMDRIQDHNFLNWLINVLLIIYAGFFLEIARVEFF